MRTYQDFINAKDKDKFLLEAINDHTSSDGYKTAVSADAYWRQENTTITQYQKLLYTITGRAVPDNYTANHKIATNVFFRFITQTVQFLLGFGVTFENDDTKSRLGRDFDTRVQECAEECLKGGVSFGFWNLDHLEVFDLTQFVPLYDEETSALMAGIRFWQISPDKPLRITLFEVDGYTDFIKRNKTGLTVLKEKQAYIRIVQYTRADGVVDAQGTNYKTLPVVPLVSPRKQSSLVGLRRQIDCHDLIESGFANDLDDASMMYWTIENAQGMDDVDLAKFIEHMKTVRAAVLDGNGTTAQAHTLDVPYQSREAYLTRIENDMYRDFMVLNLGSLSSGNNTATAIRAAYEPQNLFANKLEYNLIDFIRGILALIGVDETPTFERDIIVNELENARVQQTRVNTILASAMYLDQTTVVRLLGRALGLTENEIDEMLKQKDADELGTVLPEDSE